MAKIVPQRMTAEMDGEFVVFLIGMRINKPWKLHKWLPVLFAMPRMIKELEAKLSNCEVIDVTKLKVSGRVVFGATVDLVNEDDGREVTYRIVGEDEADIAAGLISVSSPIARALIGREEGDVVEFDAPGGRKSFEIVAVRYV